MAGLFLCPLFRTWFTNIYIYNIYIYIYVFIDVANGPAGVNLGVKVSLNEPSLSVLLFHLETVV